MTKGKVAILIGAGIGAHLMLRAMRKKMPDIHVVDSLPGNFNACTIPPFGIFILKEQAGNQELINHEMIHWQQYQRMGLLPYYYNYIKGQVISGYDLNPMEQEARANESAECKVNYTQCVRNGSAKTVFNPSFRS